MSFSRSHFQQVGDHQILVDSLRPRGQPVYYQMAHEKDRLLIRTAANNLKGVDGHQIYFKDGSTIAAGAQPAPPLAANNAVGTLARPNPNLILLDEIDADEVAPKVTEEQVTEVLSAQGIGIVASAATGKQVLTTRVATLVIALNTSALPVLTGTGDFATDLSYGSTGDDLTLAEVNELSTALNVLRQAGRGGSTGKRYATSYFNEMLLGFTTKVWRDMPPAIYTSQDEIGDELRGNRDRGFEFYNGFDKRYYRQTDNINIAGTIHQNTAAKSVDTQGNASPPYVGIFQAALERGEGRRVWNQQWTIDQYTSPAARQFFGPGDSLTIFETVYDANGKFVELMRTDFYVNAVGYSGTLITVPERDNEFLIKNDGPCVYLVPMFCSGSSNVALISA